MGQAVAFCATISTVGCLSPRGDEPRREEQPQVSKPKPRSRAEKRFDFFHSIAKGDVDTLERFVEDDPARLFSDSCLSFSPLHFAVMAGQFDGLELILSRVPEEHAREILDQSGQHGLTALHIAALLGNASAAERLI